MTIAAPPDCPVGHIAKQIDQFPGNNAAVTHTAPTLMFDTAHKPVEELPSIILHGSPYFICHAAMADFSAVADVHCGRTRFGNFSAFKKHLRGIWTGQTDSQDNSHRMIATAP